MSGQGNPRSQGKKKREARSRIGALKKKNPSCEFLVTARVSALSEAQTTGQCASRGRKISCADQELTAPMSGLAGAFQAKSVQTGKKKRVKSVGGKISCGNRENRAAFRKCRPAVR